MTVGNIACQQAAENGSQGKAAGGESLPVGIQIKMFLQKRQCTCDHSEIKSKQVSSQGRDEGNSQNIGGIECVSPSVGHDWLRVCAA